MIAQAAISVVGVEQRLGEQVVHVHVEQRYSVAVVVATLALFAVPLMAGAALQPTLLRAMTFMIVASPCAVVLATMPPLLAAIAIAGRHGVLVKSAVVMERLADVDLVVFDKTGTLSDGAARVVSLTVLPAAGLDGDQVLRVAAAAEHGSEHPLAAAVLGEARRRGLDVPHAREFTATAGIGVAAAVDGRQVRVGGPSLMSAGTAAEIHTAVNAAQAGGFTAVVVTVDGQPAGVLALADRPRPEAQQSVAALTALTAVTPVLLTGDNAGAARRLADDIGITDVRAGLLPADKAGQVQCLQDAGRRVLFVGDGVNDAPAMATADLGMAMGRHGSDLALRTADAVLVRDDLSAVPAVLALARRARRLVVANLAVAGTVIVVLVTWDLVGHLPLPLGVAGHEGSTILVALNGLRLLHRSAWPRPDVRTRR